MWCGVVWCGVVWCGGVGGVGRGGVGCGGMGKGRHNFIITDWVQYSLIRGGNELNLVPK